jgi:hypothetical protein
LYYLSSRNKILNSTSDLTFADMNVAEPLQDRVVAAGRPVVATPVPAPAERIAAAVVEANSLETAAAAEEEATMNCGYCLVAAAVAAVLPSRRECIPLVVEVVVAHKTAGEAVEVPVIRALPTAEEQSPVAPTFASWCWYRYRT